MVKVRMRENHQYRALLFRIELIISKTKRVLGHQLSETRNFVFELQCSVVLCKHIETDASQSLQGKSCC